MDTNQIQTWLHFDNPDDETPTLEGNIFPTEDGARTEWYHVDTGLVMTQEWPSIADAEDYMTQLGFTNFTG